MALGGVHASTRLNSLFFVSHKYRDYGVGVRKRTATRTEQMDAQHKGVYLEPTTDTQDTSKLNK